MADEFTKAALYGISNFNKKVKEKIGMRKLIELLNEYNNIKENGFVVDDGGWEYLEYDEEKDPMLTYRSSGTYATGEEATAILISKSYGFVKWLCYANMIDRKKVFSFIDTSDKPYEDILCLLALSDDPISDLITYLK